MSQVVRLRLVRHGRAAAGWDAHDDPGLDDVGRAQADALAARWSVSRAQPVITSPLRRCRETAAPLAAAWGITPTVVDAVREIPSPEGVPMGERLVWLRRAMQLTWAELGSRYEAYRRGVVEAVRACERDTVIISHVVAINAVIGAATGDDRVLVFGLDNCSVTTVDIHDGLLELVEVGETDASTLIR